MSDFELAKVLEDIRMEELEQLETEMAVQKPHRFSLAFRRKMRPLFKRQAGNAETFRPAKRVPLRRVWVVVAATILAAVTLTMSVTAVREGFFEFVQEIYKKYSIVFFDGVVSPEPTVFIEYEITDMPEGYLLDEEASTFHFKQGRISAHYRKGTSTITYRQTFAEQSKMMVNTEFNDLVETTIGDRAGYYLEHKDVKIFIWEENGFAFTISGNIDERTLENLVKSTKEKSSEKTG